VDTLCKCRVEAGQCLGGVLAEWGWYLSQGEIRSRLGGVLAGWGGIKLRVKTGQSLGGVLAG
jgi:hypothetical protein